METETRKVVKRGKATNGCCGGSAAAVCALWYLLLRQDLDPVAIRISDEVDAHREVFVADAAHLLVLLVRGVEVVRCDGEVKFVLAEVVGLLAVVEPGELELVRRLTAVGEVDEREIRGVQPAGFLEAERLLVEFQAALEVEDIEVVMCEPEFQLKCLPGESVIIQCYYTSFPRRWQSFSPTWKGARYAIMGRKMYPERERRKR